MRPRGFGVRMGAMKPLLSPSWLMRAALLAALVIPSGLALRAGEPSAQDAAGAWVPLFNGKDLEGWAPKFRGETLGVNYNNTYQVENGVLRVCYDAYPKFDNRFGHLFYTKKAFKNFRVRVEYRFVGDQVPEGPGWARRNNGIMVLCQDPKTMEVGQNFPVSIEVQLLGGFGQGQRSTANLCTPGTLVFMGGELKTAHCMNSQSQTFHGDQWVTVEVECRDGNITHFVNGEKVMEYQNPTLDPADKDAKALLAAGADEVWHSGYISLQAESHPTEFRKVEIMELP